MSDHFDLSAARMMWAMSIAGDAIRTYLDGALIEPMDEGALIVATCGRIMLVQHDRQAVAPRRAIIRLTPPEAPKRDEYDDYDEADGWHWEGGRVHIPADMGERPVAAPVHWHMGPAGTYVIAQEMAPADQYPDWRYAWRWPYGCEKITIDGGLNMRLLTRLCGAQPHVRIVSRGAGKAYVVSFHHDSRALGLIVPCEVEAADDQVRADMQALAGLATTT